MTETHEPPREPHERDDWDEADDDAHDEDALAREAEAAGEEREEDLDDGELATPLPGFAYDPMFGVVGGVGALEGSPDVPRLVGRWPGAVLLTVQGRRASSSTMALSAVGLLVFLTFTCMAFDRAGWWWLAWLAGGAVFAAGLAFQLIAHAAEVTFTTDGIGRTGQGGDAFVPWSEVRGYRPGEGVLIVEGDAGHLVVPTHDDEQAAEVTRLLEERGVARLN